MFKWLAEAYRWIFNPDSYSARFMAIGQVFVDNFWGAYDESSREWPWDLPLPMPSEQMRRSARAALFFEDD